MGLQQLDNEYHTYADYLTWPDDVRCELIDGVAYLMSHSLMAPTPTRHHQKFVGELFYQIRGALEAKPCEAFTAPFDARLPKGGEADDQVDTVLQPDLLVVCDRSKLDDRGLRGAPDWVVEVLSPSTAGHDQTVKLAAYERAGVPEVWLVHPTDRTLAIYRLENGRYGRARISELEGRTETIQLPGLSIDWDQLLAQLID